MFPPRVIHSVCKLLVIPGLPSQRGEVLSGTVVVVGQIPSGISPAQSYFLMKRLVIVVGSRASTSRVVVAALNYLYHSALSLIVSRVGERVVSVTQSPIRLSFVPSRSFGVSTGEVIVWPTGLA